MLPYSPLHHLLLQRAARPLVMTSGNLSDEPIAHDDDDAVARLGPLVDGLLQHDRPIHIRCDDSVVRVTATSMQVLRRSRGYAPEPMNLPFRARRPVLAVGAELKSTVSVAKHDWVVPSHHIGDLEHLATYRSFLQAVEHLPRLYGVEPELVAHDMHPEYLSTKWATQLDLADHRRAAPPRPRRCLHGRTRSHRTRAGHRLRRPRLRARRLVVGWRVPRRRLPVVASGRPLAVSCACPVASPPSASRGGWRRRGRAIATGTEDAFRRSVERGADDVTARAVLDLAERSSSPVTTSAGRLFDAVAALLGGRQRVSYEAQAAIELEALARTIARGDAPRYEGCIAIVATATCSSRPGAADRRAARRPRRGCRAGARRRGVPRGIRAGDGADGSADRVGTRPRHDRSHRRRVPERPAHRGRRDRASVTWGLTFSCTR